MINEINENADALIENMISVSGHSQRESKAMIRRILDGQTDDDDATRALFAGAFTGPDFSEGVGAFLNKRKPDFQ